MKKLIFAILALVCAVYAGEAQDLWCDNKSLEYCIEYYDEQCDAKNYAACGVLANLYTEQKQYGESKKYYEMLCYKANRWQFG